MPRPSQTDSADLRRALIIDDEPDVAGSLSDILELMGLRSEIVSAWTSAAEIMSDVEPDIVFSDLRMPGKSGIAIYRELLAERPGLARRFVLVTGDMIGARAEVESLAAHLRPQILEKPFSTLDVRGVLGAISDQVNLANVVGRRSRRNRLTKQKPPAGRNAAEGFWLRWTVSVRKCSAYRDRGRRVGDHPHLEVGLAALAGDLGEANGRSHHPSSGLRRRGRHPRSAAARSLPVVCVIRMTLTAGGWPSKPRSVRRQHVQMNAAETIALNMTIG